MSMMSRLAIVVLIAVTGSLTGACGKLKPLTEEQKRILKATNEATSKVGKLRSFNQSRAAALALQSLDAHDDEDSDESGMPSDDTELSELEQEFMNDLQKCTESSTESRNLGSAYKLSGSECPITLEFSIESDSTEPSENSASFELSVKGTFKFAIKKEKYKQWNDVDSFEFKMNFKQSMKFSADLTSKRNFESGKIPDIKAKATGEFSGTAHSRKYGDINYAVDIDVESEGEDMDGDVTFRYDYADFSAEGRITFDNEGKQILTLNGEKVSEQEFNELISQGPASFGGVSITGDTSVVIGDSSDE